MEKVQDEHCLDRRPSPLPCTRAHVRTSASSGKFAWTRERLLEGKQAERFPAHSCRAHRGGQILKEGCPMHYGQASHFLTSVPLPAPVPMPRPIKSGVEMKHKLGGEGAW